MTTPSLFSTATTLVPPPPKPAHSPLNELVLSSPKPLSWKALFSHDRDLYFHSYVNQPPLFTCESENSYPAPISLVLYEAAGKGKSKREKERMVLGKCGVFVKGEAEGKWVITVPVPVPVLGDGEENESEEDMGKRKEVRFMMQRLEPTVYEFSISAGSEELGKAPVKCQWRHYEPPSVPHASTSFSTPDWKLVAPNATGDGIDTLAVFFERWGATERGGLQFRKNFGSVWELGVVLSVGLLVERARRRRVKRGNFAVGMARAG